MEEKCSVIEKIKISIKSVDWFDIFLLMTTTFFIMFTSSFYDNWGSLAKFFLSGDVYSNYCSKDSSQPTLQVGCDKQVYMIAELLPITRFTHCASSAFAGLMLDRYGHFITAAFGMTCAFLCWLILGFLSHINTFVIISCMLMAMGVDSSAFPALMIKYRFPNAKNIVMTIIGSASSVSSSIPIIFNAVIQNPNTSFKGISLVYCFVFIGTTWIVMSIIHCKYINSVQSPTSSTEEPIEMSLWDYLKSRKCICISLYFIVTNLTLTYHQYFMSMEYADNPIIPKTLEILFIASFIPCIAFGFAIEKYGPSKILPILNLFGVLCPLFALYTSTINGLLMSICIMMIYSVFASAVFCYVQHAFPRSKFGAISGIVSTIGGIASMACMPIFRLCNKYGIDLYVNIVLIILRLLTFIPLWEIYKIDFINHKTLEI